MKNQYFGDVNDYRKYGLLRILSGAGEISIGVCWMLTASDERTDGQFLSYLDQPAKYRNFDPYLFDYLLRCVKVERERNVSLVESADVLPGTVFYSRLLSDFGSERRRYFEETLKSFRGVDLVFFDPDNGFEVPSKKFGRKDSNKYLYWHELTEAYSAGHSVIVYQHFVREERNSFIIRVANEMRLRTRAVEIYSFQTPHVVFLLAPQPSHAGYFGRQAERVSDIWKEQMRVHRHLDGQIDPVIVTSA
ncbi:MAG: hypothetical protein M3118_05575 [Actinomycetota bacterium]|nr:hypothetical protein [Actinomycetota bacterium]